MKKKTALVLGATGMVGQELLKVLVDQKTYEKIHLLVRRPIEPIDPVCEVHSVDLDRLESYSELFRVSDVFCCLGTTIKKAKTKEAFRKVDFQYPLEAAKMAAKQGAEKFLIITAMGANPKSLFFYNQVKGDIEAGLKELTIPALHIFRPSLLLGDRGEHRLGEEIAAKFSGVLNALMIGPLTPYKAIEAKTVAKAMVAAAQSEETGINIYPSNEIEKMAARNL
ncbi:oxidoreductase [Bacillus sp. FJAT-29814]|uniref:oxidoreductase n=1 Tax=Bacillus sp. FJAT-29814 TaxID=1729688 RepID=UPI000832C6F9|nr:oxidoreductase [Bacillus sp. FJAT-29814]